MTRVLTVKYTTHERAHTHTSAKSLVQLSQPDVLRAGVGCLHDVGSALDLQGEQVVSPSNSDAGLDGDELGEVDDSFLFRFGFISKVSQFQFSLKGSRTPRWSQRSTMPTYTKVLEV